MVLIGSILNGVTLKTTNTYRTSPKIKTLEGSVGFRWKVWRVQMIFLVLVFGSNFLFTRVIPSYP